MKRLSLLMILVVASLACRPEHRPMNVIIVTMDTTRADHLSVYGYPENTTPSLSRLAGKSTVFERCLTAVPITLPSHTTIFTGLYPPTHGVRDNNSFYVPDRVDTLAEILGRAGWQTAAFVGAFPVSSIFNLDQGFDLYDDRFSYPTEGFDRFQPQKQIFYAERKADKVTREAIKWLEGDHSKTPFFLWLHYFDPHQPQDPPPFFQELFPQSAYDAEIAFVDDGIGAVLRTLEDKGLAEDTIVIITADHGESLGEHGEETHAILLYDATLRVPLIIHDPRHSLRRRVTPLVRTIDIMPTALDLVGLEIPSDIQGESLLPLMNGQEFTPREAYHETYYGAFQYGWSPIFALSSPSGLKYIEAPRPELYDVAQDPMELRDLVAGRPDEAATMLSRLRRLHGSLVSENPVASARSDPEVIAKLAALGYVGGGGPINQAEVLEQADPHHKNPRDILPKIFERHSEARALVAQERFQEALPLIESLKRLDPENPEAWSLSYIAEFGLGDIPAAADAARRYAALEPENTKPLLFEAMAFKKQGLIEEALSKLEQAIKLDPQDPELRFRYGLILEEIDGRLEEAEGAYRKALALDEDNIGARLNLADLLALKGEDDEALRHYDRVIGVNPLITRAQNNRAVLLTARDPLAAKAGFERVLEIRPGHRQAMLSLASIEIQVGDPTKGRRLLQRLAEGDDEDPITGAARTMLERLE